MSLYVNPGQIRRVLGKKNFGAPIPFGPDGYRFDAYDRQTRVIVTIGPSPEENSSQEWLHASIGHRDHMPTYSELVTLHNAVWGETGWAYQCFAPRADHVNIAQYALHLFGLPDGRAVLPNFGAHGTI
jgi:hypothetical protein